MNRIRPSAFGIPALLLWLVGTVLVASCATSRAADRTSPMKRADAFLGIHFDFHAAEDCTQVGRRTTPDMINQIIDKVHPDYIQTDCKGHPGYSSYPTKVGNPAPGILGDPLRIWREVTLRRGVALFMHYSGDWDYHAVATHPDWAARHGDGKPDKNATSVFGPYVDRLMIPQLRELAGVYGVNGAWVDGDCWGVIPDYCDAAVKAFLAQTGAKAAPRSPKDPFWNEWMAFQREAFRRYLRHYVEELKASNPDFEVISNWSFSDLMPEPVSAGVAALSGDFSPENSVNSARFSGRCLENQGRPWDLMSWSFRMNPRKQKPAIQLMQEAAVILSLGGGYQAYFTQDRDGAVRLPELDTMAEVARFCRQRQAFCHRSVAVPQIALLYSTAGHYRTAKGLFSPSGSDGLDVTRKALLAMIDKQCAVQVVSEHHLAGKMAQWGLIVVPGWSYLEPAFRDELAAYVANGGRLLLVGAGPARLFERELAAAGKSDTARIAAVNTVDDTFLRALDRISPEPLIKVSGSNNVDVSPRRLKDRLSIHLVNTSGPHAHAPAEGITAIKPVGPLAVSIRLAGKPKSITLEPEGKPLEVTWTSGRASVTVPRLELYSILVVEP